MGYQTYRSDRAQGPFDAIVIGSGIGGLGVAALLAKAGKAVLVLERHYVAGGFTHTFKRKNYEWDVGVHYVGEVERKGAFLRRVFDDITAGALQWNPLGEVYDRAIFPDQTYEFVVGLENLQRRLIDYFPQERAAIEGYLALVIQATRSARGFFTERAMPPWMGRLAAPFLGRTFQKFSDQTTWEVLAKLTKNEKLIGVLTTQYGDYGLPPKQSSFVIHAMVVKHYFEGGCYPVGGSASFVNTIAPVIEQAGGRILVHAEVEKILVANDQALGVRLKNGEELRAPLVISDAGVINTYGKLLDPKVIERHRLLPKVTQVHPSSAHICLYLGLKKTARELGLGKANYWIFPGYDHDANLVRYREDPSGPLPVTYLSFPSAKDPDWDSHHPGTATMEAIGFAPYGWFQKWAQSPWQKRGGDYEACKANLTERLFEQIDRHLPQIRGAVDHAELSTPLSTQHFANYAQGEIYGLDHTPQRFRQSWLRPHTPIKNLFLTGQDIVTDGIAGALLASVLTVSSILKRNVIQDIVART